MLSGCSIVFLGNFNPSIFQPQWFERYKILPIQEVQSAEGQTTEKKEIVKGDEIIIIEEMPKLIVGPMKTDLDFPSLRIEVSPSRFVCSSVKRKSFALVKEVSIKSFTLLGHTPINHVGINYDGIWKFEKDASSILKNLFVKDEEFLNSAIESDFEVTGSVTFKRNNSRARIRFQISKDHVGAIAFNVNYHRPIESSQADEAIKLIEENYDSDREDIIKIMMKLLGEPKETHTKE